MDILPRDDASVLSSVVVSPTDTTTSQFWWQTVTRLQSDLKATPSKLVFPVVFLACIYVIYQCLLHPLRAYPGPFLAKLTNYWRVYYYLQGSLHLVENDLFHQYSSSIVRVGPSSLIFRSNEAFHAIYGFNRNLFRGDFYTMLRFVDKAHSSIVSAKTYEVHQLKRKKLISVAITPRAIASYEPIVTRCRDQWLYELENALDGSARSRIDITMLTQALSLDTIADIVTGTSSNLLSMWQSRRFIDAIKHKKKTSRDSFAFGYVPWMPKFVTLLGFVTKPYFRREKYDREGKPLTRTLLYWSPLHRVTNEVLPAAKLGDLSKPCILQSLVDLPQTDSRKMHTDEEIIAELTNLFFVGPGTTAAALISAMHDVAMYEEWQDKIYEEFQNLPDDCGESLASNAPIFQAFLRESFRLRSHGPLGFPRKILHGAENAIPGTHSPLPVGTEVASLEYTINRDPEAYGADANLFRPERWLLADEVALKRMQASWAVFGRGITACPGQKLAMMLVGKCLYAILKRWRMSTTEGDLKGQCHFEMVYDKCLITFIKRVH